MGRKPVWAGWQAEQLGWQAGPAGQGQLEGRAGLLAWLDGLPGGVACMVGGEWIFIY